VNASVTLTTKVGIAVMALSLSTGGGGAFLVKWAHAMAAPREPEPRALLGTVVEIVAESCGTTNRRTTCYRPVVSYMDGAASGTSSGQPQQLVSRTRYRPSSPHQKGERVAVYIDSTGTGWLASEWAARQAERQREHEKARDFPLVMGWMLILCAAFGLLLGLGLIFWVDHSAERPA
jgi:hypothetical protein